MRESGFAIVMKSQNLVSGEALWGWGEGLVEARRGDVLVLTLRKLLQMLAPPLGAGIGWVLCSRK